MLNRGKYCSVIKMFLKLLRRRGNGPMHRLGKFRVYFGEISVYLMGFSVQDIASGIVGLFPYICFRKDFVVNLCM